MKWATVYDTQTPQKRHLAIVGEDSFVCVQDVYDWYCRRFHKAFDEGLCSALGSMETLIAAQLTEADVVKDLYARWSDSVAKGDDTARSCAIPGDRGKPTLPFQPAGFRDFYAFEQHVATCRGKRGLDMVPEWYNMAAFYFGNPRSFIGPGETVIIPQGCEELDFELEVACVIGKPGGSLSAPEAEACIAGYAVLNDWSARDIQREEMKIGLGPAKGKDFATSLGPYLVTPEELMSARLMDSDLNRFDLAMTASVNGRQISSGNFRDIHYTFAEMIERASRDTRLVPGDVLASGTVGTGCILELGTEIQPWLAPGDRVTLRVEGLGTLENSIGEAGQSPRRTHP